MNEADIFARVIEETDQDRRSKLIDELCGSSLELRRRVHELVQAYEAPKSYFDKPVIDRAAVDQTADWGRLEAIKPGATIGPYKLLQQIGEGGMGLVFMAEQTEPVRRRVALKVIKPGMDTRQVIARFEAERQALAMMDHPNIAKVFDAGTTESGYPYFVMELVNGYPINEYCDQENLSTTDRLLVFTDVCHAIQHAHHKGVIHRDLKPNNILVAEYDGNPVPKVIDFGIAKATGPQLTDKTVFTEFGQIVGTVEYMSPEQARRNQLDVDTRSDIYSLGMVLYKLLTGETPFGPDRLKEAAWDEMLKIIREEPPELPSQKIGSSQSLQQIAKCRSVEPARLSSLVRGDLDWIVLKALEKDRNRRYPSAGELADDIDRHLSQRTVMARPPSTIDKLSKFAKRNRAAVAATVAATLLIAIAGWWIRYQSAQAAVETANRTTRMEQVINEANIALITAESAAIGDEAAWQSAQAQSQRIEDIILEGEVRGDTRIRADEFLNTLDRKLNERSIANQIEEVVIQGATQPTLESWQKMESAMRDLFQRHGFDLDNGSPDEIGNQIRVDPSSVLWADLLELWIGARAQISGLGGPKATAANMQPWAEAIYVADSDPIRTGIRRFIYTPPRKRETLDELMDGVALEDLPSRTLSWLGGCYHMVGDAEQCDQVFQIALERYPRDFMLAFDYGYFLYNQGRNQEASRMFHRCIAIRSNVAGIWYSLSLALDKLGEQKAAQRAMKRSKELTWKQEIPSKQNVSKE